MFLAAAKDFVAALPPLSPLSHDEAENRAKETAEKLGVKLGDFMMPIRMAVTGSRISPPLIGSILILGVPRSLERIERTLEALRTAAGGRGLHRTRFERLNGVPSA